MDTEHSLFSDFNFSILNNPDIEVSSVREVIIALILKTLSYKSIGRGMFQNLFC
jgi:hypothetical protein